MAKYYFMSISIGYSGVEREDIILCDSEEDAIEWAHEDAIDLYDSYAGLYGILDKEKIAEEYNLDEKDDIDDYYLDHVENCINFFVREATKEDFENLYMEIPEDFE